MATSRKKKMTKKTARSELTGYDEFFAEVADVVEASRRAAARSVNAVMTATYWLVGRRIVDQEQGGRRRAGYGEALLERLSADLSARFGRGFSRQNLQQMRLFFLAYPPERICQTLSGKSDALPTTRQTLSGKSPLAAIAEAFPLPWSHYVKLLSVRNENARAFYEAEALRGGWTIRQLNRQVGSQFYERTALSRNKAAMLRRGSLSRAEDAVTPEDEVKDPYVLEFLGLKDEYSESDIEAALIGRLETFLLELGDDFAFVGRQRRLRVGDAWYRIDLLFYHRALRCLVVIDLKLDEFTHADAGQMHLYLNYAREHWTRHDENPPVGLILCAKKHDAVVRYALDGLPNKILAAEYRTTLPDEETIAAELEHTRQILEERGAPRTPARRRPKRARQTKAKER